MRRLLITGRALLPLLPLLLGACGGGHDAAAPTMAAAEDSVHRMNAQATAGEGIALAAGRYAVLSAGSGLCVDVAGANMASGAHIQQARCNRNLAQVFELSPVAAGVYKLMNAGSGKALDVAGASTADDASLQQWDDNGTAAQQFRIAHLGGDRFVLINASSTKCIGVAGGSLGDGARSWAHNRPRWRWVFMRSTRWTPACASV
jgi:hypothetical protein